MLNKFTAVASVLSMTRAIFLILTVGISNVFAATTEFQTTTEAALSQSVPIIKHFQVGKNIGEFTLEIESKRIQADKANSYSLFIFDSDGKMAQSIDIQSRELPENLVSIFDVDGDGYNDLIVITDYSDSPFPDAALYRFISSKAKFELDNSYPGGYPTPAEKKGCFYKDDRHAGGYADFYYEISEWCWSKEKGSWAELMTCDSHTKKNCPDCTQPVTLACYKKIEAYQKKWYSRHKNM